MVLEKKLKKMEQEMEQVFEMKVKEKKKKLKESEAEVSFIQTRDACFHDLQRCMYISFPLTCSIYMYPVFFMQHQN